MDSDTLPRILQSFFTFEIHTINNQVLQILKLLYVITAIVTQI